MVKLFDENEFDKIEEEDIKEVDINDLLNTKISYKSKVMDIESILNALKRGDYKLPKYQRKYVWEKQQAANLILSLIKNIPIPPLYLYYDKDGKVVESEDKNGSKEEVPVNSQDALTKENYLKTKTIIEKRLNDLGIEEYLIRQNEDTG